MLAVGCPRFAVAEPLTARHVEVHGITVLPRVDVEAVLRPFQGRALSLDDLRTVAARLTALYRKRGYFLSRAYVSHPAVVDGAARVVALEGRLGDVDVQGNRHYSARMLRRFLQPALREKVVRYDDFMKGLLLMNEFPDIHVRATLQAGDRAGVSDVLLTVEDASPVHVTLEANNYGTRFIGTYRAGLSVLDGNLSGGGDNLSVRSYIPLGINSSPPYVQAQYAMPLSDAGDRLSFSYVNGAVAVGEELSLLGLRTDATMYGLAYAFPLLRTERAEGTLSAGLFVKTFIGFDLGNESQHDELRELLLDWSGNSSDKAGPLTAGNGRNFYSMSLTQGLGTMLGGSPNNNGLSSHAGAGDSFTHFNFDVSRLQALDSLHTLSIRATGQLASGPLTIGEQFALGGPDTVRGYRPVEVLGDDGYTVSVELRRMLSEGMHGNLQGLLFVDHGGAFVSNPQPFSPSARFLTAAGVGFRVLSGQTTMKLDCGFPIAPAFNSTHTAPVLYGQVTSTF